LKGVENALSTRPHLVRLLPLTRELREADFHLRQAVENGGDELAERIAGTEAPFGGTCAMLLRSSQRTIRARRTQGNACGRAPAGCEASQAVFAL
jgi:hypothetical protein